MTISSAGANPWYWREEKELLIVHRVNGTLSMCCLFILSDILIWTVFGTDRSKERQHNLKRPGYSH